MDKYFVTTSKGLVDALTQELEELGVKVTDRGPAGVYFEGDLKDCYRVNLYTRIGHRVLKVLGEFRAKNPEELYHEVKKFSFLNYLKPSGTMMVDATVKDCGELRDQRFIAMKAKDAVVDRYREECNGERPNVDSRKPDMRIHLSGLGFQFHISVDTSGDTLFARGYRTEAGEAPLRETLAAGLLTIAGWDKKSPIIDPMCGSGTILIEAALMALNIAPGTLRKGFAFQRFEDFDQELWDRILTEAMDNEKEELDFMLYGYDLDKQVLNMAKANARRAGVDEVIQFARDSVATVEPPVESGVIITNPPYGARWGEEDILKDVYRDFGYTLKTKFPGWNVWMISGNKELTPELKLRAERKYFLYNGPIECRFLHYKVNKV